MRRDTAERPAGDGAAARTARAGAFARLALGSLALALAGCATRWTLADAGRAVHPPFPPIDPCRVVADVALTDARGELRAVAHISLSGDGRLRAHLGADSGLTILDVEIDGAAVRVHAESELGRLPGLRDRIVADLRRTLGDRSLLGLAGSGPDARSVVGDAAGRVALALPDGSWVAVAPEVLERPGHVAAAAPVRATLLRPSRAAEADVVYEDAGPDGVPRGIELTDLDDGHRLVLEVAEVLPLARAPLSPR